MPDGPPVALPMQDTASLLTVARAALPAAATLQMSVSGFSDELDKLLAGPVVADPSLPQQPNQQPLQAALPQLPAIPARPFPPVAFPAPLIVQEPIVQEPVFVTTLPSASAPAGAAPRVPQTPASAPLVAPSPVPVGPVPPLPATAPAAIAEPAAPAAAAEPAPATPVQQPATPVQQPVPVPQSADTQAKPVQQPIAMPPQLADTETQPQQPPVSLPSQPSAPVAPTHAKERTQTAQPATPEPTPAPPPRSAQVESLPQTPQPADPVAQADPQTVLQQPPIPPVPVLPPSPAPQPAKTAGASTKTDPPAAPSRAARTSPDNAMRVQDLPIDTAPTTQASDAVPTPIIAAVPLPPPPDGAQAPATEPTLAPAVDRQPVIAATPAKPTSDVPAASAAAKAVEIKPVPAEPVARPAHDAVAEHEPAAAMPASPTEATPPESTAAPIATHVLPTPPMPPANLPQAVSQAVASPAPSAVPALPAAQIAPVLVSMMHAPDGAQRLMMRLEPPELGHVEIRIDRPTDAPARVDITVERTETLTLLLRDQPQLQRALDQAGVPPEGRSVTFHVAAPETAAPRSEPAVPQPMSYAAGGLTGDGSNGTSRQGNGPGNFAGASDGAETDVLPMDAPVWVRAGLDITA